MASIHLRPTEFNTTSLGTVPLRETMDPLGNGEEGIGSLWDEPQVYNQALVLSAKVSVSCFSVVWEQCHQPRNRSRNKNCLMHSRMDSFKHDFFKPPTYICLLVINRKWDFMWFGCCPAFKLSFPLFEFLTKKPRKSSSNITLLVLMCDMPRTSNNLSCGPRK